jgi:hypothetical protein
MTLDQLLPKNVADLEAMTDAQLQEYFKPLIAPCRPDPNKPKKEKTVLSDDVKKPSSFNQSKAFKKPSLKNQAAAILEQYGLKLD